uniref:Uncharacterized protein n=1 Tax=Strigamia maritima TaxID=126957 RepID=T1IUG8_STRMM
MKCKAETSLCGRMSVTNSSQGIYIYLCVLFLALIAASWAQSDEYEYDASSDGGEFDGDYGDESREVAGSHHGDSRFNMEFDGDSNREKRSIRVRRGHKSQGVVGPVFTHVKTDHNGNFKWGVKHKVGGGHGHGGYHH